MNWKLVAGLACGMALLLGACSGSNTTGTSSGTTPPTDQNGGSNGNGENGGDTTPPTDQNGGNGGGGGTESSVALTTEETAARDAVRLATMAIATAETAGTKAARDRAQAEIVKARSALDLAVSRAEAAYDAARGGTDDAALGTAKIVLDRAREYRREQLPTLTAADSQLLWFTGALARQTLARDAVLVPREDVNDADISRIQRRDVTPGSNPPARRDNPNRIKADTFKDIPYASGKMVFSTDKENEKAAHDGTETFKVNAYTNYLGSNENPDDDALTGLRLTSDGLIIRFGGPTSPYPDTIMKLGTNVGTRNTADNPQNNADPVVGSNQWDLTIKFDAPQTVGVDKGVASWTGNGDFYWKAIAEADDSQLLTTGANYNSARDQFPQPAGHKDLGVYEVWLSNHIGVDTNAEDPEATAQKNAEDDDHLYLKYAAYGLFLYTADDGLAYGRIGGFPHWSSVLRGGRVQGINFGYSAFQDATGKKTSDIKTPITGGKFTGETIAIAYVGDGRVNLDGNNNPPPSVYPKFETKLARGDVELEVSIPKTAGSGGTIKGSITSFEEWDTLNSLWKKGLSLTSRAATPVRGTVHTVYLNVNGSPTGAAVAINEDDGIFAGAAKAYAARYCYWWC